MKCAVILLFIIFAAVVASAQVRGVLPPEVRGIKLLESTRAQVKQRLLDYELSDDDSYEQEFTKENLTITVLYSRGTCTADPDDEDASENWNVGEGKVTRIEISLDEPIKLEDSGLVVSKLRKEPRFPEGTDSLVLYDKVAGFAVKTVEEGIESVIIFPPLTSKAMLCRNSTAARGFYTRSGWFSQAKPYDFIICVNGHANVDELKLNVTEVEATGDPTVSVVTIASDPENDILTYNYIVSVGKIVGNGSKVVWDLAGVGAGSYTITAGVDDGCGLCGKTLTKTVVIK